MAVFWYYGRVGFYKRALAGWFPDSAYTNVYPLMYFSISSVVLRMLVPIMLIKLVLRKKLGEFGFSFKGTFSNKVWMIYVALYLLILPVVIYAGGFEAFQAKYPLCRDAISGNNLPLDNFIMFQVFYFFVFLSGESFWRGFIIFGLKPRFGWYSIPIMIIPYVMAHFGKPFPETVGAVLAGSILGYLALRHGNFWLGVLTHYAVALTMDLTSIFYRGISFI